MEIAFLALSAPAEDDTTTYVTAGSSTNANTFYVGRTGTNNTLYVYNQGRVDDTRSYIGYAATADANTAYVWGAGSVWSSEQGFSVGYRGSENLLVVGNGGRVENNNGYIGRRAGADDNGVLVTGSGSVWTNGGDLYVGYSGARNALAVYNGGRVFSDLGVVGSREDSTNNVVEIRDAGSGWTTAGRLTVGGRGRDNLVVVTNGAVLEVRGQAELGKRAAASGNQLVVDGSRFSVANDFRVGRRGSNSLFRAVNGAVVENGGNAIVGDQSAGNLAVVRGAGTRWSVSGRLVSGNSAGTNRIEIADGAAVSSGSAQVGRQEGADGNEVAVGGSGTTWTNLGVLYVGNEGARNRLAVEDGARVGVGGDTVVGKASDDNELSLDNAALSARRLDVGRGGSGNILLLENGADAFLDGDLSIGRNAGSSNNLAAVLSGSRLLADELYVGYDGSDNELQVLSGAEIESVNAHIGHRAGANGNTVRIEGAGSVWSNEAAFYIGGDVSSTGNLVRISDGGGLFSRLLSIRGGSSLKMNGGSIYISQGGGGSLAGGGVFLLGDQSGGSTLLVEGGGRVASGRTVFGNNAGAGGNAATVTGAGSEWTAEYFVVGRAGASNRVSVLNGGRIESARTVVGKLAGSTGNQVLVSGEGTEWRTSEKLVVGYNEEAGNLWRVEDRALSSHFSARIASNALLHLENATFRTEEGLRISRGGSLSGWGWVDGSVTNLGLLDPGDSTRAGTLAFNDSLTLLDSSEVRLTLWSTSSYDRIVVDGDFAFDGTLVVEFGGGYTPQAGDTFDLFDWGGSSGSFGASALAPLSGSLYWDTSDLYTTGTIRAIPEPAAAAFILLSGAGLVAANRIFRLREGGSRRPGGKIR